MPLAAPDFDLPGWEVLHIYQDDYEDLGRNAVLLLHRTVSTGDPFAICKIIPPIYYGIRGLNDATPLAMFPPHPNIIKVYSEHDDVPHPGHVSLVLEFCAGEDLFNLSQHAWIMKRRIPEVFLWHMIYQTLVALQHMNRYQISHEDLHIGNLLLRPVEGDAYPDVVLADFEFSQYRRPYDASRINDLQRLGDSIQTNIVKELDEIEDGAHYSPELRDFVKVLSADNIADGPTRMRAEIDVVKQRAYGNTNNINTHRMPAWMIAYFVELKSKRFPGESNNPEVRTEARRELPDPLWESRQVHEGHRRRRGAISQPSRMTCSCLCCEKGTSDESQREFG
ncbi:hypothetical protein MMC29_000125 [Sticta canariensis]|nr:hypothetical protein [Sticta canariensis]